MFCFLMVSPLLGPVIKTTFKSRVSINYVLVVVVRVADITPVSNVCEVAARPLFWALDGLNELPEVRFDFRST